MVELLKKVKEAFGGNLEDEKLQEALCFDKNQGLAGVGNDVLDLCNSLMQYKSGHSDHIDSNRQSLFTRDNHRTIVNSDPELVEHLIVTDYKDNNQKQIGLERADRYLEAIIGALYLKEDKKIDAVIPFVKDVFY